MPKLPDAEGINGIVSPQSGLLLVKDAYRMQLSCLIFLVSMLCRELYDRRSDFAPNIIENVGPKLHAINKFLFEELTKTEVS